MANFGNCLEWVLRLEDRTMSGKTVTLADGGGRTRFGIAETKHLDLPETFYTCPKDEALEIATDIYWRKYWMPIYGSLLPTDELAATLLSFAVNDGVSEAVKLLQGVLRITADGRLGALTLAAIGKLPPDEITAGLRTAQGLFYKIVTFRQPEKLRFLTGWLNRAAAIYPELPA